MRNIEQFAENDDDSEENPEENRTPEKLAYIPVRDAGHLKRLLEERLIGGKVLSKTGRHKIAEVAVSYSKDYAESLCIKIISAGGRCWTGSLDAFLNNYTIPELDYDD